MSKRYRTITDDEFDNPEQKPKPKPAPRKTPPRPKPQPDTIFRELSTSDAVNWHPRRGTGEVLHTMQLGELPLALQHNRYRCPGIPQEQELRGLAMLQHYSHAVQPTNVRNGIWHERGLPYDAIARDADDYLQPIDICTNTNVAHIRRPGVCLLHYGENAGRATLSRTIGPTINFQPVKITPHRRQNFDNLTLVPGEFEWRELQRIELNVWDGSVERNLKKHRHDHSRGGGGGASMV